VREVLVHAEGFSDAQLLHHHEAEAVHEAALLIPMPRKEVEGCLLILFTHTVDMREVAGPEVLADLDRPVMPDAWVRVSLRPGEGEGLPHDEVGRDE
jgi:hypothetical protein